MGEPAPDWWRTWFGPGYLALYDETLGERTPIEIDRLEALLQLRPPIRILDLPCGQGRHAIELARRRYDVTGVDLSPYLLDVAKARAKTAGVEVRWLEGDIRRRMIVERTASRPMGDEVNVHAVRLYTARELDSMLRASGFDRVDLYGDWDGGPVSPESLRVLAVGAREKEKAGVDLPPFSKVGR